MRKHFFTSPEEYFREAERSYGNAKDLLRTAKIENERYLDLKPVREACGTAYLAALLALDGYFLKRGLDKEKLPTSAEGYEQCLRKYSVHNGKLKDNFYLAYDTLHIHGYYRGIEDSVAVKGGFGRAKDIIETVSNKKVSG